MEAPEPAVSSFEQPASVLPSVETNDVDDAEILDPAANSELPCVLPRNPPNGSLFSRSPFVGLAPAREASHYGRHSPKGLSPLYMPSSPDAPVPFPFLFIEDHDLSEAPAASLSTRESSPARSFTGMGIDDSPATRVLPLEALPGEQDVSTDQVAPGRKRFRSVFSRMARRVTGTQMVRSVAKILSPPRAISPDPDKGYEIRYSNLDQLLMKAPFSTGIRWVPRQKIKVPKNKIHDIMSPSNSPSNHNRVEKSSRTTPIRRTRSSYADISRRRRTEASGRIERTLYRLPELLSQNEADREVPLTADQTNPQTAQSGPPMTAHAAGTVHLNQDTFTTGNIPTTGNDSASAVGALPANPPDSPGLMKWAFNQVSRRWTNIRDRYAGNQPTEAQSPGEYPCLAMQDPMLMLMS